MPQCMPLCFFWLKRQIKEIAILTSLDQYNGSCVDSVLLPFSRFVACPTYDTSAKAVSGTSQLDWGDNHRFKPISLYTLLDEVNHKYVISLSLLVGALLNHMYHHLTHLPVYHHMTTVYSYIHTPVSYSHLPVSHQFPAAGRVQQLLR
jgi:hypothetical protein